MTSENFPQTLLTLLLPFSISLALYLIISHVLVPLWQRQRDNIPLDTISAMISPIKTRCAGLFRRRERDIEAWDDDEVNVEEGDGMLRFEQQREAGVWRGR